MENNSETRKERDEFGPIFSRVYSFFAGRSRKQRAIYSRIAEDIEVLRPSRILEIGSGPGIAASLIAEKLPNARITCVDPSATMVSIANSRFKKLSISNRVSCMRGNSTHPGVEGAYDIIFCSLSFHHWERGTEDIQKLVREHMPRGTFIIYENLLEEPSNSGKHGHGISKEFMDTLEIPGLHISYQIDGGLVCLRLSNVPADGASGAQ